jgi:putative ABC transport system permease protein
MTGVFVKAMSDLRRRRLQAAVVFVTTLLAVVTSTMSLTLLSQTRDPYEAAFEAQKGAHLQVRFDGQTDRAAIARTPALIGASAFGGPYVGTDLQLKFGNQKLQYPLVSQKSALSTYGRDNPGGDIEQLRITSGRWPSSDSEIALTRSFADQNHISVGDQLKVVSVAQEPVLTVAALVIDVDEGTADVNSQRAWVLSSAIASLSAKDSSYYQMLYRFAEAPTSAQLQADLDTLQASLPPGSILSSVNYLLIRTLFDGSTEIFTNVLLIFSVIALAGTVAIVANLVTGIVISAYREIGIMKAVGFTPVQVVGVFVLQVLIPAAAACVVGIPAGTILAQPLVANSFQALGLDYRPSWSAAVDLLALAGALLIVTLAALLPAVRAGSLKPAVVIANATAPRGQSGRWLRRIASRARLPRPIVLGVGDAVSRPVRAFLTLIAISLGVTTVVVALGLPRSFDTFTNSLTYAGTVDVVVNKSPALTDADATRLVNSQPETLRVIAESRANLIVPGIANPVSARIFRGDSSAFGDFLVAGRWIDGPGEVLAPRALMQDANLKIGDSFTATFRGVPVKLRIVGEVFDAVNLGHELVVGWSTIAAVVPDLEPFGYLVMLKPGSNVETYVQHLDASAPPDQLDAQAVTTDPIAQVKIIDGVLFALAAVIALIAAVSIFNTLLLNTRERVRDTATLKALGMSPREVMVMVTASAVLLALVGGLIATPIGAWLSRFFLDVISNLAGNDTPPAAYHSFVSWQLIAIPLAGVVVAVAAAMVPGRWAARTNVVEVLHAE